MIGEALEEVLDTPGPEPAPYPALGTLVTVGHGHIPGGQVQVLLHALHHLLFSFFYKIQKTVLGVSKVIYRKASLSVRPWQT